MNTADKIARKLAALMKCIEFLESNTNISIEDLKDDYTLRSAIERNFQLAIESCIDIGEIIIADEGLERPEDYRSVILILGKNRIISEDFAERFSYTAGFRNILVHMYEDVDIEILHSFLTQKLGDFRIFAKSIADWLEEH